MIHRKHERVLYPTLMVS